MDDRALDEAEVTIFYETVTYRGAGGAEKKAMRFRPYGMLRFDEAGQERDYVVPIHINVEILGSPENTGYAPNTLRFNLEPAPAEDGINWMHQFGHL